MKRRFDNGKPTNKATVVDCLECEHYYTSACDGNAGGCKAYTPTRKITLEDDIRFIKALSILTATLTLGLYIFLILLP